MSTRRFTQKELHDIGMKPDESPEEWESENIVDCSDTTNNHGTALDIVFRADGKLWRITVGYHHEDWAGTNDIEQCSGLDAEEVREVRKIVSVYESIDGEEGEDDDDLDEDYDPFDDDSEEEEE